MRTTYYYYYYYYYCYYLICQKLASLRPVKQKIKLFLHEEKMLQKKKEGHKESIGKIVIALYSLLDFVFKTSFVGFFYIVLI